MNAIDQGAPLNMLLHVGYQRTGSTWLQRVVFDNGKHGFLPWSTGRSEQRAKVLWEADRLDYSIDEMRQAYLEQLRPDVPDDACVVLSNETLAGNALGGGYDCDWNARALNEMFPHARVLIVVREQRSILMSMYAHYVSKGGTLPLKRFLDLPPDGRLPGFKRSFYQYHKIVRLYQSLFGADRVLVLAYEMIDREPYAFVERLQRFCGTTGEPLPASTRVHNAAASPLALKLMRLVNPLRKSNALNNYSRLYSKSFNGVINHLTRHIELLEWQSLKQRQQARWRQTIEELAADEYDQSNRLLAEMTGLPLVDYGYSLTASAKSSLRLPNSSVS